MTWRVDVQDSARKELRKLDPPVQDRILAFLRTRVATDEEPDRLGKMLRGQLGAYWCYRVGDYRIICEILRDDRTVRVRKVGHRRDVYRR